MKKKQILGLVYVATVLGLATGSILLERRARVEAAGVQAPRFEVDPMWPKPLPNHWVIGSVIGVSVDSKDHIWMVNRTASLGPNERGAALKAPGWEGHLVTAECCVPAPPVLEFDQAGNLLHHWGGPGPGYEWPLSEHGIFVDYKDNVWLAGNNAKDAQIVKFTEDGKFLLQIGHQGKRGG